MDAIIIGGFLGSGKTTTVINMGKELAQRGHTVAIIVNEVGEVGIDGDLISKYGLDTKEITNGCICCTLKLNMKATITELYNSYMPDFIIVEPSGIAFPNVIKKDFELMNFGENIKVSPLVTLIDGSRFKDIMKSVKVYALRQIEDAEILAINKTDLVDPIMVPILEESIQQLNNEAKVIKMSSDPNNPGFLELMEIVIPQINGTGTSSSGSEKPHALPESPLMPEGQDKMQRADVQHRHTHYDSESSGLASYANDYKILEDDIDSDMARLITMEIAEGVKEKILNISPEFVGHIKMFLETQEQTFKISITSYSEVPAVNVIQTTAHSGPRFKILTAVSGIEEDRLVHIVDENVEYAFAKRDMLSQRLHNPHDHDHEHDHEHDDDDHEHGDSEHRHEQKHKHDHCHNDSHLNECVDDIYDHEVNGCSTKDSE